MTFPATLKPLNAGELASVADLYVIADNDKCFYVEGTPLDEACRRLDMIPIFDAESELVCLVPKRKVELLARLINTYQFINDEGDRVGHD